MRLITFFHTLLRIRFPAIASVFPVRSAAGVFRQRLLQLSCFTPRIARFAQIFFYVALCALICRKRTLFTLRGQLRQALQSF